jgi:hypothetical protein
MSGKGLLVPFKLAVAQEERVPLFGGGKGAQNGGLLVQPLLAAGDRLRSFSCSAWPG